MKFLNIVALFTLKVVYDGHPTRVRTIWTIFKKVCHRYHNNKQRYCVFVCMRSLQAEYLSDDAKMLWTCLHLQFTNNDKERTHEDL